jgi:hypothetical protein
VLDVALVFATDLHHLVIMAMNTTLDRCAG